MPGGPLRGRPPLRQAAPPLPASHRLVVVIRNQRPPTMSCKRTNAPSGCGVARCKCWHCSRRRKKRWCGDVQQPLLEAIKPTNEARVRGKHAHRGSANASCDRGGALAETPQATTEMAWTAREMQRGQLRGARSSAVLRNAGMKRPTAQFGGHGGRGPGPCCESKTCRQA